MFSNLFWVGEEEEISLIGKIGNLQSECKRNVGGKKKSRVLGHVCMNNNASEMIMDRHPFVEMQKLL